MKIRIVNDFRNQKAGWEYDFSQLKNFKSIVIVGDNGSGKSTILQAIRGTVPKHTNSLFEEDYKLLAKNVEVEHNYENIIFHDAIQDNGSNFMNAYDALNYVEMGGYAKQHSSHGEGALHDLGRFLDKHKGKLNEKTLVVLDEADNGLSTKNMAIFNNFVSKLALIDKCNVLVVSHNPFFIIQSIVCYDIAKRRLVSSREYIKEVTGYDIKKASNKEEN